MTFLKMNNVNLWYEQTGEGPDIVWIPGGDNVASDWHYQIDFFKGNFKNTSFDPRGAGKTEIGNMTEWSIKDMADDCAELIRKVCNPPVYVAGISMGGLITLQMAVSYPELVKLGVVMGAASHCTGWSRSWMEAEIEFRKNGGKLTPAFARHHYGVFMYPPEVIDNDELWEELLPFVGASYEDREGRLLIGQWQACVDFDVSKEMRQCDVPLHMIGFSLDIQCPPSQAKRTAKIAKNGTFHLMEGLGHLSLIGHKSEAVNKKIAEIIKKTA